MAITIESIHYARENGEKLLKIGTPMVNCIQETIGALSAFTHNDYDFVKTRISTVEHLELIIQAIGDSFFHSGKMFDDAYANLMEQIISTSGTGDIDPDVLEDIEAYINDDESYRNQIMVPAYMVDHLANICGNEEDLKDQLSWERVSPDFMITGEQAKDVKLILLNTICTRDVMRENGGEDILQETIHCIGDYVDAIKDDHTPILYEIMEAVNSEEMQRMVLGVQTGTDEAVVRAGTSMIVNMTNRLVTLANDIIKCMAYTRFYLESLPSIVNDAHLIAAAYSRYQLESAVHF